jgi:hypothetical protein
MPSAPFLIMQTELPQFLQDVIASPPRAGEGVHAWLFRVSRQLHAHLPAGEIVRLLETQVADCGRHVPRTEIVAAVQNALPCAWQPSGKAGQAQTVSKWPAVNQEQRGAIIRDGGGLADLWEASPVRIEDNAAHTEEIIDALFHGNPFLCCGADVNKFDTRPREDWRGHLAELALIVPSPMNAVEGVTKDGKSSRHTLSNTGPRRFLIVEFDTGMPDDHAALLLHLASFAPMVLAVHSGNKSLHGWFYCAGQSEDLLHRFMRYSVSLGADHATWTRFQFVRMPDGARDNGRRPTVFFFNPKPLEVQP